MTNIFSCLYKTKLRNLRKKSSVFIFPNSKLHTMCCKGFNFKSVWSAFKTLWVNSRPLFVEQKLLAPSNQLAKSEFTYSPLKYSLNSSQSTMQFPHEWNHQEGLKPLIVMIIITKWLNTVQNCRQWTKYSSNLFT